eukprot:PITA_31159
MEESQTMHWLLPYLNATFIALIPKEEQPNTSEKYRPIALCNVIYKIISKFITDRLKLLLHMLISQEQSGYVEGRQILDGIILTHEIIHSLKHNKDAGLSHLIKHALHSQNLRGISVHGSSAITHQQFVDDNMLFGHPSVQEAYTLKSMLDTFCEASGTTINTVKSQIFFFHTPLVTKRNIARILVFPVDNLPSKYLGTPLIDSAIKHTSWHLLLEKIENHLSLWTYRALNMASRLVLVKAVLQAMPLYLFSVLAALKWVLKNIKDIQRTFLWGSSGKNCKWVLVKWSTICTPNKQGGLGLRDP